MKANKYGATKTIVDGITFHSKKEAKRYGELKLLERADDICGLVLQPRYKLVVNGQLICTYVGDFLYTQKHYNGTSTQIVEDVKGHRTREYINKAKLFQALFPHLTLVET